MGLVKHDKRKFSQELISFLDIQNTYYSLNALEKIITNILKYNINTDELTLNANFKSFFMINEDTIKLKSLMVLILLKHNKNEIPIINYFDYYQNPIEITDNNFI